MDLDLGLVKPQAEDLQDLAMLVYGKSYQQLEPEERATAYGLAVQQQQASALSVLAQYVANRA